MDTYMGDCCHWTCFMPQDKMGSFTGSQHVQQGPDSHCQSWTHVHRWSVKKNANLKNMLQSMFQWLTKVIPIPRYSETPNMRPQFVDRPGLCLGVLNTNGAEVWRMSQRVWYQLITICKRFCSQLPWTFQAPMLYVFRHNLECIMNYGTVLCNFHLEQRPEKYISLIMIDTYLTTFCGIS